MTAQPTTDALETANLLAARATRAYLLGRGFAAEIDDARFADDHGPIAAPGLDALLAELGDGAGDACNAADRVGALLTDPDVDGTEPAIRIALGAAAAGAETAERATRRLAALLLGVTSQSVWNDAVARAERAAVMVLHPPGDVIVRLVDEGIVLRARYADELVTELCGTLCRMIIDHDCELGLRVPGPAGPEVRFRVDAVGNLAALARTDPADHERLAELGWPGTAPSSGELTAAWDDPLSVVEPARLAAATLQTPLGPADPQQLRASLRTTR